MHKIDSRASRPELVRTAMLGLLLCAVWATALAQAKLSLADELRAAIEQGGAAGVKQRFAQIWPAHKSEYKVDTQALSMMTAEYIAAGDREIANAVGEISGVVMQDMMQNAMATSAPGMAAQMAQMRAQKQRIQAQEARDAQAEKQQRLASQASSRGKARDDLDRFVGLYGTKPRQLFVTQSCDGYLVVGALWADTTPWWMRSAADTVFSYSDNFTNLAVEFTTGDDGQARGLTHDMAGLASPLARAGKLPVDLFPECLERPRR